MKTLLFVFTFFVTFVSFSQKVKIKKGQVFVDGEEMLYLKPDGVMTSEVSYYFLGSDDEFLFTTYLDFADPSEVSSSNPEGKVRYIEMNFVGLNKKFEISSRGRKSVVEFLIENKVIENGELNEEVVDKLIQKYGMRYSERNKNGNVNIIINN